MLSPVKTLRINRNVPFVSVAAIACLGLAVLFACPGCGADLSGTLGNALSGIFGGSGSSDNTSKAVTDLVGTWSGNLTTDNQTLSYQFTVDSSGKVVGADNSSGTATLSSSGGVAFTFLTSGYTVVYKGTLSSDKTQIVMTGYSWSGAQSGSAAFSGSLTKSGGSSGGNSGGNSSGFLLTDLAGTWTGTLTENGQPQSYTFNVTSSGSFTTTSGMSGTAAISTGGVVIFTYSSGGFTGTFQGTMNAAKTQITMSTHTWTGTSSGTAAFTGTLAKS